MVREIVADSKRGKVKKGKEGIQDSSFLASEGHFVRDFFNYFLIKVAFAEKYQRIAGN